MTDPTTEPMDETTARLWLCWWAAREHRAARQHLDRLLDGMLPTQGHCALPADRQCGAYAVHYCTCKRMLDQQEAT